MMALCWKDKWQVYMLSTATASGMESTGEGERAKMKPITVIEYNKNMGVVDQCDMQMSFTESTRKAMKWYKKLFFHLLDVVVFNAYILFKAVKQEEIQLQEFQLQVIKQLANKYAIPSKVAARPRNQCFLRLIDRHFVTPIVEKNRGNAMFVSTLFVNSKKQKKHGMNVKYAMLVFVFGLVLRNFTH